MKKFFRKEVVIGLCVIAALAILFFGINFLKGVNLFRAANYYYATYTNVEGLAISAPVTINGYKVGQVREINYQFDNPGHVVVSASTKTCACPPVAKPDSPPTCSAPHQSSSQWPTPPHSTPSATPSQA